MARKILAGPGVIDFGRLVKERSKVRCPLAAGARDSRTADCIDEAPRNKIETANLLVAAGSAVRIAKQRAAIR